MKIGKLLLTGVIALGLMACNNEDTPVVVDGAESTVSIKVVPSSDVPGLRATGDLSGNGVLAAGLAVESEIKQLEVYIFHGDTPDGYKSATPVSPATTVTEVKEIATHKGAKTIVVVANANIGAVTSKAVLLAKTKDLPVTITNGLVMTSAETAVTLEAGKNYFGYPTGTAQTGETAHSTGAPLKITRVNARVAIVGATLNLATGQENIFTALTDAQVAIFNVPKTTNLFGSPLATNTNYLFGGSDGAETPVNWPSSKSSYTVGTYESTFKDATVAFPILNTTAAPAAYYYVNENTAEDVKEQMLIVLRAKPTKGEVPVVAEGLYTDAAGYTYYPVWVNANKTNYSYGSSYTANSKIIRNTQYNISLTITGIGNPTIDPVEEAWLDVMVSVAPWEVVNQNVTW